MMMQGKKETATYQSSLPSCLQAMEERIGNGYGFVSPCYEIVSPMDSCADDIDSGDISIPPTYLLVYNFDSRVDLRDYEEEALSCAEQYSTPSYECDNYYWYCVGDDIHWKCDGDNKGYATLCEGSVCEGTYSDTEPRNNNFIQNELCVSSGTCTDSDGGNVPKTFGYLIEGTAQIPDACFSDEILYEQICVGDGSDYVEVNCKTSYGDDWRCQTGVCVQIGVDCYDSDGGKSYFEKGVITKDSESNTDVCVDSDTLREYFCENNEIQSTLYGCSNQICAGGRCVDDEGGCPTLEWTGTNCPTMARCAELLLDALEINPTYDCTGTQLSACEAKANSQDCEGVTPTPSEDPCGGGCLGFVQSCGKDSEGDYTFEGERYGCKTSGLIWMLGIFLAFMMVMKMMGGMDGKK